MYKKSLLILNNEHVLPFYSTADEHREATPFHVRFLYVCKVSDGRGVLGQFLLAWEGFNINLGKISGGGGGG